MKRWLVVACAVLFLSATTASAQSESERCRLRVGHERPAGCAPYVTRTKPVPKKRALTASKPRTLDADFQRSLRYSNQRANERRSTTLLMRELVRLERLLRVTPRNSPERAAMIRRLAEGYAELEQRAASDRIRADLKLQLLKQKQRRTKHPAQ